jgi:hypothetical protein
METFTCRRRKRYRRSIPRKMLQVGLKIILGKSSKIVLAFPSNSAIVHPLRIKESRKSKRAS